MSTTTLNISSKQELLDLINEGKPAILEMSDVSLSVPEAGVFDHPEGQRNTKVVVTAESNSSFTGSKAVFYNRLDVSTIGQLVILTGTELTNEQLLSAISVKAGIDLLPEEFETIVIPTLETGNAVTLTLRAKADALKWFGEGQVELKRI